MTVSLDDFRWLVDDEARTWLARLADDPTPMHRQAARLRGQLSAARTHLLLEQVELRRRGRAKFALADRLFFTPKALEQATDQWIAAYKASRCPAGSAADLCCGIGGDLMAFAALGAAVGVESDPAVALLAEANLAAAGQGGRVECRDATQTDLAGMASWHIDPDRRPRGKRTVQACLHRPTDAEIDRLLSQSPHAAVKLAPAADTDRWPNAEREWISRDRQCRQQVLWLGDLAVRPGLRRATVISDRPGWPPCYDVASLDELPQASARVAERPASYVFDPDAAVVAAGLVDSLAVRWQLDRLAGGVAYLTGDVPRCEALAACFAVREVVPFDERKLKRAIAARNWGRLEVKVRGVQVEPAQLIRRLAVDGDGAGTVIIAPTANGTMAILAQRVVGGG